MKPLLTPSEMSAADERTIAGGTPGRVLMERAGRAVARTVIRLLGHRYGAKVAVVCGKGNNGGDGFVIARSLALEGVGVRCLYLGDVGEIDGDPAHHRDLLIAMGGPVEPFDPAVLRDADAVVDAIFGTGFRGVAEGSAAEAIEAINSAPGVVVAVDIPSGVDGATGAVNGPCVTAHTTVTFGAQKIGTAVGAGAERSGDVEVIDIGIEPEETGRWISEDADVASALPQRDATAHKRTAGSVALLGGSEGMSGAVILAARAAVRMGAGYATVGLPRAIDQIVSAVLPEVLTRILADGSHLEIDSAGAFKPVLERSDVVAVGPGLGEGEHQQRLVSELLETAALPLVLDADALNVLARDTSPLMHRSGPAVITPHPAELARLLQMDTGAVQADRVATALDAADRFGSTVVLKGYRSLIAGADGRLVVNTTGSSHLATAGTGDVLTGVIAALIAAGMDVFDAAWAGVHVHGVAGEVAASKHADRGVLAWDVAEALPEAISVVKDFAWA